MSVSLPRRLRPAALALAGAVVLGAAVALVPAPSAQAAPAGLQLIDVKKSLLATYTWYRQTAAGHPVVGSYYVERVDNATGAKTIEDGRLAVPTLNRTLTAISAKTAVGAALARTPGTEPTSELVVVPGSRGTLAWQVLSASPKGSFRTLVDAASGAVLSVTDLSHHADGKAQVFSPNPVVRLQDETLTDQNDADYAKIAGAYKQVDLTHLDGSGFLRGDYAYNANPQGQQAKETSLNFQYKRNNKFFEQVMAYRHITVAQEYIQSIGFTNVNNEPQDFVTIGLADDNSFYDPSKDRITFGTGGVDDAEDQEVIWHELGHAIQDAQIPGFGGSTEAGAIGEGFGDYWAYTMSEPISVITAKTPLECIADWDSVSYTTTTPHCLRRVDGTKSYPGDIDGEVHDDGEIWSRALRDFHKSVGRTAADKIILEAQFGFTPSIGFKAAAQKIVATAKTLGGASAEAAATKAFKDRGIL